MLPLVLFLLLCRLSFSSFHVVDHSDGAWDYGHVVSWRNLLNIHESSPSYIKVDGKYFDGVRGSPPYFVEDPLKRVRVFASGDQECSVHVLDTATNRVSNIAAGPSGFGYMIASPQARADYCDAVSRCNGQAVTVKSRRDRETESIELDLGLERLVKWTFDRVDEQGKVVLHKEGP